MIRAHLEEDAGKSMHHEVAGKAKPHRSESRRHAAPGNRQPARHAVARKAKAYLDEMKLLLTYLGVSDCNMQEGSLRVDANIDLHIETPSGGDRHADRRSENMNSFRAVERAITYEAGGSTKSARSGKRLGDLPKSTRGWDETARRPTPAREGRVERLSLLSGNRIWCPSPTDRRRSRANPRVAGGGLCHKRIPFPMEETYGITPYDSDVLVNQGRPLVK